METQSRYALRFAIAGFVIAMILGSYAFYLNAHGRNGDAALFLILCPPSFAAIALDSASVIEALIGWLVICLANAGLYAVVGLGVGTKLQKRRN
ncbi:MAG: hypothetical protein WA405_04550 [Candidatus Acidiferrales bacterium]